MRVTSSRRLLIATAIAAGIVGVGASAASGGVIGSKDFSTVNRLKGSHGYTVVVYGNSGAFKQRGTPAEQVTISASKGGRSASYSANGKSTLTRLKADFGSRGKVDLTFHGKGRYHKVKLPKGCHGKRNQAKKGTWKGTLKFKGEGGYTKVTRHSIAGHRVKPGDFLCNNNPGPSVTFLSILGPDSQFFASRPSSGAGRASITANVAGDPNAPVRTIKSNHMRTKRSSAFSFSNDLTSASTQPGGMFSGSSDYTADPPKHRGGVSTVGTVSGTIKSKFLGETTKTEVVTAGESASLGQSD